jgi:O-acetyl-ADP-ribose deacetylase (regulator of RNase III)
MPFQIVQNDITKMNVDAIVNAANQPLQHGGGVCGAIFDAAGAAKLQEACNNIGRCKVGHAVMTPGFNLSAANIIHTVGPIWHGGTSGEEQLLKDCYSNSLLLAKQHHCSSIAFPLISSGIYGYPKENALQIAIITIRDFLLRNDMMVYLVIYDATTYALGEQILSAIEK